MKTTIIKNDDPSEKIEQVKHSIVQVVQQLEDKLGQCTKNTCQISSLDELPGGFIVLNKCGVVSSCNHEAEKILGIDILGMAWVEVLQQTMDPQDIGLIKLKNGRILNVSTKPIDRGQGQAILLSEVTASFQQQINLEQQNRLAAMGEMLAKLAHQIRTPLSSALIMVSQLGKKETPASITEKFIHKTHACLKHLNKLINDMLCFSKSSAPALSHFTLDELFSDLECSLVHLQAGARHIEIVTPKLNIEILANKVAILACLENVVVNAWQAIDKEYKEIIVASHCRGNCLTIIVSDNGPGIPAHLTKRIFEPFFTTKKTGTGLGLAVAKASMESHGGKIEIRNFNGGCDVLLHLPINYRENDNVMPLN